MKTRFFLPTLILCSSISALYAEDVVPAPAPAIAPAATAPAGDDLADFKTADDLWQYLQKFQQTRPKTKEEALEYFGKIAATATAFDKKYPTDERRWTARLLAMSAEAQLRGIKGQPMDVDADRVKLDAIIAAEDAPKEMRAQAAFLRVRSYTAEFQASPKNYILFNQAAADFMAKYADSPLVKQMQRMQLEVLSQDPTPEGAATLKKLAESSDTELAGAAKGLIVKQTAMAELKSKPVDLAFTTYDGKSVDLAMMRGKVVLVDFWASWCGPCIAEMPNVTAAYGKLHDKGFEILGISLDSDKDKMVEATKKLNMTWPQYFDGEGWKNKISTRYGINSIPATWLIDKKGMLRESNLRGPALEEAVARLLKE